MTLALLLPNARCVPILFIPFLVQVTRLNVKVIGKKTRPELVATVVANDLLVTTVSAIT